MYDLRHLNYFRQLSGLLLHYARLDGYDLYCFEKKIYTTSFAAVVLKKKILT